MRPTSVATVLSVLAAIALPSGAQTRTGNVLVADQESGTATIVDVATHAATTIPVGTGPHETIVSPDGRWGVVTIYGVGGPEAPDTPSPSSTWPPGRWRGRS